MVGAKDESFKKRNGEKIREKRKPQNISKKNLSPKKERSA